MDKVKTMSNFRLSDSAKHDLKSLAEQLNVSQAEVITVLVQSFRQWRDGKVGPLELSEVIDLKLGYDLVGFRNRINGKPQTLEEQIIELRYEARNGRLRDENGKVMTLDAFEELAKEWRRNGGMLDES